MSKSWPSTSLRDDLGRVLSGFSIPGPARSIERIGSGHINDSYLVTPLAEGAPSYVLQRINHTIFKNVPGLMENIRKVTAHLERRIAQSPPGSHRFRPLRLIPAVTGETFHHDAKGNFWRLYNYLEGSHSYDVVENTRLAREGGKAFGTFQLLTSDLDGSGLTETIPFFHDMGSRLGIFRETVTRDPAGRAGSAPEEIRFAEQRSGEMMRIRTLLDEGRLPLRVTHNDTKFNNILFDDEDRAICIVDLDTVMPGTILFDFGDAIRTGASSAAEDEQDLSKVRINLELFEAYTEGYLSVAREFLVPVELDNLAFSARFMTFIIGLRFLTDYLDGDRYYKTAFKTHNLVRARTQFRLVESMEQSARKMDEIVTKYR